MVVTAPKPRKTFPPPRHPMLVTILVVCFLRPILRCPIQRQRTVSVVLIGAWLIAIHGDLNTGFAQATSTQRGGDSSTPTNDASARTDLADGGDPSAAKKRLREGTSIPPTIGHVVKLGRRWAFMPIDPNREADDQASSSHSATAAKSTATSTSADDFGEGFGRRIPATPIPADETRSQRKGGVLDRQIPPNDPRETHSTDPTPRNDSADQLREEGHQSEDGHLREEGGSRLMILCENQMLQRIVEASDAEDSHDRWQISGEILEYFNQNRLLIRTIQRASAPLDSPQPASTP